MPKNTAVYKAETFVGASLALGSYVLQIDGNISNASTVILRDIYKEFGDLADVAVGIDVSGNRQDPVVALNPGDDPRWPKGAKGGNGWNFVDTIPGSNFAAAGDYRVEYTFSNGSHAVIAAWNVTVKATN